MKTLKKKTISIQKSVRFIFCLTIFLASFASPTPAWACSCAMSDAPAVEFSQANAVFQGQVINKWDKHNPVISIFNQVSNWLGIPSSYSYNSQTYGYQVVFSVLNSWKGVTTTTVDVTTGYGGGDCGYGFQIGTQYIVYSYSSGSSELFASICSRTTHLGLATEDLVYLNSLPVLPLTPVTPPSAIPWLLIGAGGITLILILMTIFLLYRRQQVSEQET